MSAERFSRFSWILMVIALMTIDSQDVYQTGLLSIDHCRDTMTTAQYFACKLDECQEWITFIKCPDGFVSTGELNLHQKCMVCKDPSRVNSTDIYQELLPSTKCTASFEQGEIFWCNYENCWFAFSGCDQNETRTKYINFKTKKIHCLPRQTTTENSDILTEPPAPTARHSIFSGCTSFNQNFLTTLWSSIFSLIFCAHFTLC